MPKFRNALPQLNGQPVITDGGLETVMLFHERLELPEFCSFPLLRDPAARRVLDRYYDQYAKIATRHGVGLLLESVTWRANPDWLERVGMRRDETADVNREAVDHLVEYRESRDGERMVISGCVGPRRDGYVPEGRMSADEARDYHSHQINTLGQTEADLVSALTLNYVEEAIGVAQASEHAGLPCAISFTVETDGRLPTGQPLGDAIQQVDEATDAAPAYYMINCAHPTHFEGALAAEAPWLKRMRGLRANASTKSHAELEEMEELDEGDPADLGARYRSLRERLQHLSVLGGCCGTDHRHVAAICEACFPVSA